MSPRRHTDTHQRPVARAVLMTAMTLSQPPTPRAAIRMTDRDKRGISTA